MLLYNDAELCLKIGWLHSQGAIIIGLHLRLLLLVLLSRSGADSQWAQLTKPLMCSMYLLILWILRLLQGLLFDEEIWLEGWVEFRWRRGRRLLLLWLFLRAFSPLLVQSAA